MSILQLQKGDKDFIIWTELLTPLLFLLADYGLKKLSFNLHNRDFYINLKGVDEKIERNKKMEGNLKFTTSDRLLSITLVLLIFMLPFIFILVERLYN